MLKQILLIVIIALVSCKDRIHQKNEKQPVPKASQFPKEYESNDIGIVKWIRDDVPNDKPLPASISKFISQGCEPLFSVSGDINSDGRQDIVLVTAIHNEDDFLLDTVVIKRELLLLLAHNNTFKLAQKNKNIVPSINCCGGMSHDAFAGIKASKGQFTLLCYGGSNWKETRASTFKFDKVKQDWFLDNEIKEFFFMDWQNYEVDTLTKKDFGIVPLSKFNIYKLYGIE